MGINLLKQFLVYSANKEKYNFEERQQILQQFREELKLDIDNMD